MSPFGGFESLSLFLGQSHMASLLSSAMAHLLILFAASSAAEWRTGSDVNVSRYWLSQAAPGRFRGRTPCAALGYTGGTTFVPEGCPWDPPVLWSFPGSGNTWVRQMLEQATGLATGSVYNDQSLRSLFRGEMHCAHDTLVNKAHAVHTPFEVLVHGGASAERSGNVPTLPWHGARTSSPLQPRAGSFRDPGYTGGGPSGASDRRCGGFGVTRLAVAAVGIVVCDLLFAFDSTPVMLSVTRVPMLLVASQV